MGGGGGGGGGVRRGAGGGGGGVRRVGGGGWDGGAKSQATPSGCVPAAPWICCLACLQPSGFTALHASSLRSPCRPPPLPSQERGLQRDGFLGCLAFQAIGRAWAGVQHVMVTLDEAVCERGGGQPGSAGPLRVVECAARCAALCCAVQCRCALRCFCYTLRPHRPPPPPLPPPLHPAHVQRPCLSSPPTHWKACTLC